MFLDWIKQHGGFGSVNFKKDIFYSVDDRKIFDSLPQDLKDGILKNAEKYLGCDWQTVKATDWMAFNRTGDRMAQENKFFKNRQKLNCLALAECVENKGRFLDDIINGLYSACEESFWGLSAHMGTNYTAKYLPLTVPIKQDTYVDIFAACTAADICMIMTLLETRIEKISPVVVDRVKREMQQRIITQINNHFDYEWFGLQNGRVNNWNPWICSNVITVLLKYCSDPVVFKNCLGKLFVAGEMYLRNYSPDGACDEGPMYWGKSGGAFFEFLHQLYLSTDGGMNLFDREIVKLMSEYISFVNIGNNQYVDFADGHANVLHPAGVLYAMSEMTDNPELAVMAKESLADSCGDTDKLVMSLTGCGKFRATVMLLPIYQKVLGTKSDGCRFKTDKYFKDLSVLVSRQSDKKDGLFFAAKAGHNDESGAHNHNDVGNFLVYSSASPLIIDAGTGVYSAKTFSDERYDIWTMQSGWHNTPTVNGEMQFNSAEAKASEVLYTCSDCETALSMELSGAYHKTAGISSIKRSSAFNRKEGTVEIVDKFLFDEPNNTVTENIILAEKPEISDGCIVIKTKSGEKFCLQYSGFSRAEIDYKETENDRNLRNDWGSGIYRLRLIAEIPEKEATLGYKIIRG